MKMHRDDEGRATQPLAVPATGDARRDGNLHHNPTAFKPRFRERERAKELGGDWASANRVPTAAQQFATIDAAKGAKRLRLGTEDDNLCVGVGAF